MPTDFPQILRNGLWHSTHPARFALIKKSGVIVPNPDLPEEDRWKTNQGPEYFPYVRHISGISIFDFNSFDPVEYSENFPMSSWRQFVPYRKDWGQSVWLEIDSKAVVGEYLTPDALARRQQVEKAYRHTLMPRIEAAVVGHIPLAAIKRVLLATQGGDDFEDLGL